MVGDEREKTRERFRLSLFLAVFPVRCSVFIGSNYRKPRTGGRVMLRAEKIKTTRTGGINRRKLARLITQYRSLLLQGVTERRN